jgi:hypothetical protein
MYCYGTFLFEHDVISLSVYVCFIVFRHDMAEITVESGVKHHNLNPLEHDVITLSVYVCFIVFRHDMAEITVKSGVKHHNLNPLTPDLSLYSKAL